MSHQFPQFVLSTGRKVYAEAIYVEETYAGLLEGVPNEGVNKRILEAVPEQMRRIFGANLPIHVLPFATEVKEVLGAPSGPRKSVSMPPVQVSARLICYDPITKERDSSWLIVVWYQSTLWPLPSEDMRIQLESIDWDGLAADFDW